MAPVLRPLARLRPIVAFLRPLARASSSRLTLAALSFTACGGGGTGIDLPELPDPAYGGGDFLQILRFQDLDRGYTVHVPAGARADVAAPLLIVLHGAGQDAPGIRQLAGVEPFTDPAGWIVVYPQGYANSWAIGTATPADERGVDDVGLIRRMLDDIDRHLNIDRERVYAAGISNGSLMTHRLACELSTRIRGIVSVAGTMLAGLAAACAPSRPVATLFFHGDEDTFFPWEGWTAVDGTEFLGAEATAAFWADENGCGAPVRTDVPDAASDGTTVERVEFACPAGGAVRLFAISGGGHTWPGRGGIGRTSFDIEANEEILAFFGAP